MPNPVATFHTSVGDFSAEIYLDRVPITASNFIDLCKTGPSPILTNQLPPPPPRLPPPSHPPPQASTMEFTSTV
jgi:hypothetical protein